VLTNPLFFEERDWIEIPSNWANSIVQGKSYDTNETIGAQLWSKVEAQLYRYLPVESMVESTNQFMVQEPTAPTYGELYMQKIRVGQGAFRVLITDAYKRKCAVTGEKTLPVLEAAHIKSYSESGPQITSNGILLRSDMHKLFDSGYLTITPNYKIEISNRIKEEFQNGREYYQYHGKDLSTIPIQDADKPNNQYIEWHNTNIYKG
jgi:putative restriction endonuclease